MRNQKKKKTKRDLSLFLAQILAIVVVWLGFEAYSITQYVFERGLGISIPLDLGTTGSQLNATRTTTMYCTFSGVSGVYLYYLVLCGGILFGLAAMYLLFKRLGIQSGEQKT